MATQESEKIFECVKLFEVEESSPTAGGEKPINSFDSSSSIGIDQCCWKECTDHTILVLVCNNGYIVTRVSLGENRPVVKQLKWFESRQRHILGVVLDPLGEWLVCACLDGSLYLVPILALMLNCALRNKFGSVSDITVITPRKKIASPTSLVWWETMDGKHICITGSEVGEVTFFDIKNHVDLATVYVSGCVDTLMTAHHPDTSTYLLIGLRGGEWRRMLLEEHYHEVAGTSYTDATASGFEVLPDDIVIKSFTSSEGTDGFDIKPFSQVFSELNHLSTQEWQNQHCLSALNLRTHKMEVYSYDFDLMAESLETYQLVPRAMGALLTERVLFVISHDDEANPCAFQLSVMSRQRSTVTVAEMTDETALHSNALLQQFTIPSHSNLVGFYATTKRSHDLDSWSCDPDAPPTSNLGGCLIVTTTSVYMCCQILSPEKMFLDLAMSQKTHEKAEDFGITFKLDVCGLYKVAAERKLVEKQFSQALRLFELSRCPSSYIIDSFSRAERVPELVSYLHRLVYDDLGHAALINPKQVQDVLLKCFIHECLRCHGQPEGAVMTDKFGQFINDKFLYNQAAAIDMLIECGLKEQLFELAKSHRKLADVLQLLVKRGSMEVDSSIQSSLASRQYAEVLSQAANGLFLYQMTPSTFVRLLNAKPSIISSHMDHLHSLLPRLDISTLLRLAHLFDPSHDTIRPQLIKAHSRRKRSNSTGSLLSVMSSGGESGGEETGPRLDAYLEMFLTVLIILNHKRQQKLTASSSLLSLSPLRSVVSGSTDTTSVKSYAEGDQWVRGSTLGCGLHHAALVVHGNLYTWGSTKNGKLGHGDIEEAGKASPLRVETLSMLGVHVVSVSCGAEHTIALCQEGVFSWGSSSHGQLGHGDTVKKTRPVQLTALADKSVVSVVCGQYHSLALDDDHRVWTWGWGVHGQLGLKSVDDKLVPTHASLLDDWQVSFIAAGYGHSAVLTAEGKVLTFGNGMYGQLGHGNTEKQTAPKMVEALQEETAYLLACGNFHNIVVTTEQCLYFWGKNLYRPHHGSSVQGLKEYKRSRERQQASANTNTLLPHQMSDADLDGTAVQVACGSFHALLLTSEGSVYSWGSNNHGQLGQSHTAEKSQPVKVAGFEDHKVVAIATGDEFSLAVDDRGTAWTWGRTDQGQLGVPSEGGSRSRQSHSIFRPRLVPSIPTAAEQTNKSRNTSPDQNELPVLELDLGWELPDFATIGSHHTPYGRKALDAALDKLYGFYRTSKILWVCQDWCDWESMTVVFDLEKQWSQALKFSLKALMEQPGHGLAARSKAGTITDNYLQKFIGEGKDRFSANFIREGHRLLLNLVTSWEKHHLDFSLLEGILYKHLPNLCYPLSLILRGGFSSQFSFEFHLSVSKEVTSLISTGYQPPDDIIRSPTMTTSSPSDQLPSQSLEQTQPKKLILETSVGDSRLWVEILRNLSKDLSKHNFIVLPDLTLANVERQRHWIADTERSGGGEAESQRSRDMVSFSCGHAFSLAKFQDKMLLEFVERVQDFPVPIPQTLKHLQLYFRQSSFYPSACLHCVFQYLRKVQLQESPEVPIRPWNP